MGMRAEKKGGIKKKEKVYYNIVKGGAYKEEGRTWMLDSKKLEYSLVLLTEKSQYTE